MIEFILNPDEEDNEEYPYALVYEDILKNDLFKNFVEMALSDLHDFLKKHDYETSYEYLPLSSEEVETLIPYFDAMGFEYGDAR